MPHSGPQRVYMEQRHDSISTSFGGLDDKVVPYVFVKRSFGIHV